MSAKLGVQTLRCDGFDVRRSDGGSAVTPHHDTLPVAIPPLFDRLEGSGNETSRPALARVALRLKETPASRGKPFGFVAFTTAFVERAPAVTAVS